MYSRPLHTRTTLTDSQTFLKYICLFFWEDTIWNFIGFWEGTFPAILVLGSPPLLSTVPEGVDTRGQRAKDLFFGPPLRSPASPAHIWSSVIIFTHVLRMWLSVHAGWLFPLPGTVYSHLHIYIRGWRGRRLVLQHFCIDRDEKNGMVFMHTQIHALWFFLCVYVMFSGFGCMTCFSMISTPFFGHEVPGPRRPQRWRVHGSFVLFFCLLAHIQTGRTIKCSSTRWQKVSLLSVDDPASGRYLSPSFPICLALSTPLLRFHSCGNEILWKGTK